MDGLGSPPLRSVQYFLFSYIYQESSCQTRMHSSRMRTGRSLTVCCSLLPGGVSAWSGGVLPAGGCLPGLGGFSLLGGLPGPGGVSVWSGGVLPARGGVCLVQGGLPGPGGGSPEAPSPPVYRITDTYKNITLATTSLRPVIIDFCHKLRG